VFEGPASYTLRIEILDSDPPIWRRLCVDARASVNQLHWILASVMGWTGQADFRLRVPRRAGTVALTVDGADPEAQRLTLKDLVTAPGDAFSYTYSLRRGWIHTVVLEASENSQTDLQLPYCLAGERAGPPEFCVGIWGYEELLDQLSDPDDPQSDELWDRVGYDFDPEWFAIEAVNRRLRELC
jgi:hypothetical protein